MQSTTSTGPVDEISSAGRHPPASRAARLPQQLSSRHVMATGQDHCRAPTARPRLNHEVHGSTGGASGGPAGASIERRSEQPLCLQPSMICSRLTRVDEAGPSHNLINNRCQPTAIGAHAHLHNMRHCPQRSLPQRHATLLAGIARLLLPVRPNRVEPRAVKRRPKPHRLLTQPRNVVRARLEKRQRRIVAAFA